MPRLDVDRLHRRNFLRTGALALPALASATAPKSDISCIYLMLVGGPSQLDTWDPKPEAPREVRGPYRPIKTNVPGIEISEIFPRMARHADKFSLIRSLHHDGPAVHDTGHQLMQTGRIFSGDVEHPHFGCVVSKLQGGRSVLLPQPIGPTGANLPHGQSAGYLGPDFAPLTPALDLHREPRKIRESYGLNPFGQSCLQACRLVEQGVRFVTVNMFETVFDQLTWDIHGAKPFSPMSTYRDFVGPMFDMAYSSLLQDLHDRGLLKSTMVVAAGEFGRTPHINATGGRDHWSHCWTMPIAGGPIVGGQVIGSSDKLGAYPQDRPVTPAELAATIYQGLGIAPHAHLPGGFPLVDPGAQPIGELLRSS